MDQLDIPTDVIVDKKNNSLIICDYGNRRVVRWSYRNSTNGEILISKINCYGLAMNDNGDLYVSDEEKHQVRRWKVGETNETILAVGNWKGNRLDQLNSPGYIFVDEDHSIYVSDCGNHRVMKWIKGAKEGIVVAGGHGNGNSLRQLDCPLGMTIDQMGNIYVADCRNDRIMCWPKGSKEGRIVVGGKESNQFNCIQGLSFDRQGNLYVVDRDNNRVQRFDVA